MAAAASTDRDRFSALDGLRGLAALTVVVSHSANVGYLPSFLGNGLGQMGVVLFFGLSGFLMAHLHFRSKPNVIAIRRYAIHRASRVLPLFYAIVATAAILLVVMGSGFYGIDSLEIALLHIILVHGTGVLWTVPVECQFYAIFVIFWAAKYNDRLWTAVAIACVVQAFLCAIYYVHDPKVAPDTLVSWFQFFVAGMLLGSFYSRIGRYLDQRDARTALAPIAWFLVLAVIVVPPEVRRMMSLPIFPNFVDPVTAGYPIILLFFTIYGIGPFANLSIPILRWYGRISYSLYLLHVLVIDAIRKLVEWGFLPHPLGFPFILAVSTAVAACSFHFLERPMQTRIRSALEGHGSERQRQIAS